jgi:ribose 1,5-bisphosphokinase
VNGSREYFPHVFRRYRDVVPLLIEVSPDVLRDRLLRRGRENREQIEKRLQRHRLLSGTCAEGLHVNNDGPLSESGDTLIGLILHYCVEDCPQPSSGVPL